MFKNIRLLLFEWESGPLDTSVKQSRSKYDSSNIRFILHVFVFVNYSTNEKAVVVHLSASYRETNMKSGGHPAQNGWIHILWPVGRSHHHHL